MSVIINISIPSMIIVMLTSVTYIIVYYDIKKLKFVRKGT